MFKDRREWYVKTPYKNADFFDCGRFVQTSLHLNQIPKIKVMHSNIS